MEEKDEIFTLVCRLVGEMTGPREANVGPGIVMVGRTTNILLD